MADTEALVAHYRTHGWVRVPQVISPERLAALRADVDGIVATLPDHDPWHGPWTERFDDGDQFALYTAHGIHVTSVAWASATQDPAWLDLVSALMGVPARVSQSTMIVKPPRHGQAFPPHQDSAYYGKDVPSMLVALFHVDTTRPENGPIRYLDGSHAYGHRVHDPSGKKHLPTVSLEGMTEVCAQAGDVVCAHIHTVHGSYPNRSEAPRRLVRVVYQPV